jgi:hypothetical protein
MFAAFVDTMPLKWNLHFPPQSFFCNGIYRFWGDYAFIGYMNSDFYENLSSLGKHYRGRFNKVFNLTNKLQESPTNNTGKVKVDYSSWLLHKVLEYVSINDMLLRQKKNPN